MFVFLKKIRPLLILSVCVAVAVVMVKSRTAPVAVSPVKQLPYVELQTVQLSEVPIQISGFGEVRPDRELAFASEVMGAVEWLSDSVKNGVRVKQGDVLCKIDPLPYELALANARANLASAELVLADAKALRRDGRIKEAQAKVAAASKAVSKAADDLANTTIRAPFDAVVDNKQVELGQYVTVGRILFTLLSTERAEITVPLSQVDVDTLGDAVGIAARITPSDQRIAGTWQGQVLRVEQRVSSLTRVEPIVVGLDSPYDEQQHEHTLKFGSYVNVELQGLAVDNAVLLPLLAVHANDVLYVVDGDRLRRREVSIVHRDEAGVVVAGGIQSGDRVVLTRIESMFDGMQVASHHE